MNGIINVLKPPGMTSHDVVYFIRKQFKTKKVGHTGTLDPEAAGVLPICIGKATKTVQYLTDKKKRYRANIKFGIETTTYDQCGEVTKTTAVEGIDRGQLEMALKEYIGEIEQVPPIYSAIKVNGKKLYQYARDGEYVELESRNVHIYSIDLIEQLSKDEIMVDVHCSKGTYIRSLCYDIGTKMGYGAHMSQLVRMASEPFTIDKAYTLEEIEQASRAGHLETLLMPIEKAFESYPAVTIKESAKNAALCGNTIYQQGIIEKIDGFIHDSNVKIICEDLFLGIGIIKYSEEESRYYLRIKKLFI